MKRLRPKYSDEELSQIYATPHDHTKWPDHIHRVEETIRLSNQWLDIPEAFGADLSCGDGEILRRLNVMYRIYGDYAPGYAYQGPIEKSLEDLSYVDVFVLCETLEHLNDPVGVLKKIRKKTDRLILSTPDTNGDDNPEHYWSWNRDDIGEMLEVVGFRPSRFHAIHYEELPDSYTYQLWLCN